MNDIAMEPVIGGGPETVTRSRVRRGVRAVVALLALGWTSYWVAHALPLLEAQSALWNGGWRPTLDGYEVFEFLFVASHSGVRWLPGIVGILFAGWALERRLTRRPAASRPAAEIEPARAA